MVPVEEVVPQPTQLHRHPCGSAPCTGAGRGGGHHSIKYNMYWPSHSLLFVQRGVYGEGEQGWVGSPHQVPSQPQQKGSTQVPEGCETQGH